jgi:hypothetical protein
VKALRKRGAVVLAIVAVAAFAIAFGVARSVAGDDPPPRAEAAEPLPAPPVPVNNLERAPTMKPLRSVAGVPAP